MRVASAISTNPVPAHATGEVLADLLERFGTAPALAVIFTTPALDGALDDITAAVDDVLSPGSIVAVVSAGVMGDGVEVSGRSVLGVWCTDSLSGLVTVDVEGTVRQPIEPRPGGGAAFMVIDGFDATTDSALVIGRLLESVPDHDVIGGVLSAAAGSSRLVGPDRASVAGLVLTLDDAEAATIWGAAPIDEVRFAEVDGGSMVTRLDGDPALDVVVAAIEQVDGVEERREVSRSLRLALLGPDEFGMVAVLGTDRSSGAIAIGGSLTDGSLVQLVRGDAAGLHDSIIRTLLPQPGSRLLATTGLDGVSSLEPDPVSLVAELSEGAIGPVVAAVIATVRGDTTLVDAPLAVITCQRSHE